MFLAFLVVILQRQSMLGVHLCFRNSHMYASRTARYACSCRYFSQYIYDALKGSKQVLIECVLETCKLKCLHVNFYIIMGDLLVPLVDVRSEQM